MIEGRERHEDFTYPDDEYVYYIAAERFGWTPTQVDEQPARIFDWIIAIGNEVEKMRSKSIEDKK